MRYFIDPFGCVKNQVDAENMMAHLNNSGWECSSAEDADLIIVNSCGFIESAKRESIEAVLEWRKQYPDKKILLAGCLAQRYAKELSESLPEADGFFGVENITDIVNAASDFFNSQLVVRSKTEPKNIKQGERPLLSLPGSAYVKISEGCDNNCSYCAIPLIRGSLKCRTISDITEECGVLLDHGVRELCLVGQDLGSYGREKSKEKKEKRRQVEHPKGVDNKCYMARAPGNVTRINNAREPLGGRQCDENVEQLFDLLTAISELNGNFWVRLLYIHPDHFPLQILDIMEKDRRFLPYFDIPFQHASPKILAAMNRHGNPEKYLALLETIRARLPGSVIRTTFMLGFPGETEDDFSMLLDFQEKAALDWVGCFAYSREEDTASYSMNSRNGFPRVPVKVAAARKQLIEERQIAITERNMDRFTRGTFDVLLEEKIESAVNTDSLWLGRIYCQAPEIDGSTVITGISTEDNLKAGMVVPCKVIARHGFDLEAVFFI